MTIRMTTALTGLKRYGKRVVTCLSVTLNVMLGGELNQTFSARNHQWQKDGKFNLVWLIDAMLGKDHCTHCWVYWKVRKQW